MEHAFILKVMELKESKYEPANRLWEVINLLPPSSSKDKLINKLKEYSIEQKKVSTI